MKFTLNPPEINKITYIIGTSIIYLYELAVLNYNRIERLKKANS